MESLCLLRPLHGVRLRDHNREVSMGIVHFQLRMWSCLLLGSFMNNVEVELAHRN